MAWRVQFAGPARDRLQHSAELAQLILEVSFRRLWKGPKKQGWSWFVELATELLKRQVQTALDNTDVKRARRYLDSMAVRSSALKRVNIAPVVHEKLQGSWFCDNRSPGDITLLYLHGGGYSFYPRSYASFIALITLAAKARTFALDYRLTPEHRFPAQLEDALQAYCWLLTRSIEPGDLVIAGDSAGGHLVLSLLLKLRELGLPQPALAIALSPPTDFEMETVGDEDSDWISGAALLQWRDWFCGPEQHRNPLVSPLLADLRNLPPIYIQAGCSEILFESIQAFADRAGSQGADIALESWQNMNHVFQLFGQDAPQSSEALRRIGEVVDLRVRTARERRTVAC